MVADSSVRVAPGGRARAAVSVALALVAAAGVAVWAGTLIGRPWSARVGLALLLLVAVGGVRLRARGRGPSDRGVTAPRASRRQVVVSEPKAQPLHAEAVVENRVTTSEAVMGWWTVPPTALGGLVQSELNDRVESVGRILASLVGRSFHLRVFHTRFKVDLWARQMAQEFPAYLPDAFPDLLRRSQEWMLSRRFTDKHVMLGVELAPRPPVLAVLSRLFRASARWEQEGLDLAERELSGRLSESGLEARLATAAEMTALFQRSATIGAPGAMRDRYVREGGESRWGPSDLAAFTDPVVRSTDAAYSRVVRVGSVDGGERFVAVGTIGHSEFALTKLQPWGIAPESGVVPVELSLRGLVLSNQTAARRLRAKLARMNDQQKHDEEHGKRTPFLGRMISAATNALDAVGEVPDGEGDEAVADVWMNLAVEGATEDAARDSLRRAGAAMGSKMLVVPSSSQMKRLGSFTPGERLPNPDHTRHISTSALASGLWHGSTFVGHRTGILLGEQGGATRGPFMVQPFLLPENDESGFGLFSGRLGCGKTGLLQSLSMQLVDAGVPLCAVDYSGRWQALCALPEYRNVSRVHDVIAGARGSLSPWVMIAEPRRDRFASEREWRLACQEAGAERASLAVGMCLLAVSAQLRDHRSTEPALSRAANFVSDQSAKANAMGGSIDAMVEYFRREEGDNEDARNVAEALKLMRPTAFGRLVMPQGVATREDASTLMVVHSLKGIEVPDAVKDRRDYSLAVRSTLPILALTRMRALRSMHDKVPGSRSTVAFDELSLAAGADQADLQKRLAVDTRKTNTFVGSIDHNNTSATLRENRNLAGFVACGSTTDPSEQRANCEALGLPVGVGFEDQFRTLQGGGSDGESLDRHARHASFREFIVRIGSQPAGRVQVRQDHLRPSLLAAMSSRPAESGRGDLDLPMPNEGGDDLDRAALLALSALGRSGAAVAAGRGPSLVKGAV